MKRATKQQFIRYTSKYLKDLPLIVTHRGVDDLIVKEVEDDSRGICEAPVPKVQDDTEASGKLRETDHEDDRWKI